ncbi:DUF2339 domain-containing protein [Desulfosarcina sp. OttesenSCG-928-B08]|nr:DUF2339 domain-containing protein [Desulfosarcina sp. OttesenSCG-928-B08]
MIWIATGLVILLSLFSDGRGTLRFSVLVLACVCLFLFRRIRGLERQVGKLPAISAEEPVPSPVPRHRPDEPSAATPPSPVMSAPLAASQPDTPEKTDAPYLGQKSIGEDRFQFGTPEETDDLSLDSVFDAPGVKTPEPVSAPTVSPVPEPEPVIRKTKPVPYRPYTPPPPSGIDRLVGKAWAWLTTGNLVLKVGLVILLLGVSFLLKYAAAHILFPPELRAAAAALLGIALLVTGWKLRNRKPTFALLVQGGGIATLYLTIFAVTRFLGMIPPEGAIVLMTAIVVCSAILAIFQNAVGLAMFGWAGGFMAPILLSTGTGSHIYLFSYYALLNAGLLGVSVFRSWRSLHLMGFFCTFGIGSVWGLKYYRPEFFATTEPFLILFFLMYGTISILFARPAQSARSDDLTRPGDAKTQKRLDSVLIFGLPLIGFGLQAGLVQNFEMGTAFSCLALSAWYLVTTRFLWKEKGTLRLLGESHIGLGIIFLSLAVPMALDATATASTWALEGAGMVWLGLRQKRPISRIFGLLLQIGAAISFFVADASIGDTGQLLAGLFLGIGGFVSSWAYGIFNQDARPWESSLQWTFAVWGGLFWYGTWWTWSFARQLWHADALLLIIVILSHLAWIGLARRKTSWSIPDYAAQILVVFLFLIAFLWHGADPEKRAILYIPGTSAPSIFLTTSYYGHPFTHCGWLLWPVALAVHFVSLYQMENKWRSVVVHAIHAAGVLLTGLLVMWETGWQVDHFVGSIDWAYTVSVIAAGLLLTVAARPPRLLSWPLSHHNTACMQGAGVMAAFISLWWVYACLIPGNPRPLPYLPILNILDLGQALVLAFVFGWLVQANRISLFPIKLDRFLNPGLAAAIFVWINVVIIRIAYFWGDVDYSARGILGSEALQAVYSVLWTLMAVLAMVYSHRRLRRKTWMAGAGLLGLVVVKLLFVDLSGHGTVARIVSFLGVGILMLVVGYLCPLPPKEEKK